MDASKMIARLLRPVLGRLMRRALATGSKGAPGHGDAAGRRQARRARQGLRAARRLGRM